MDYLTTHDKMYLHVAVPVTFGNLHHLVHVSPKPTTVCEYVIPKLQLVAAIQPAQTASPKPVSKKPSPDSGLQTAPPASPKFVRPAIKKPLPVGPPPAMAALGAGSAALAASAGGNANARVRHAEMAQTGSSVCSSCQSTAETASA